MEGGTTPGDIVSIFPSRQYSTHLSGGAVHDVQKVAVLVVHDPGVLSRNRRIYPHHGASRFVREGDRVGLPPTEGSPVSSHEEATPLWLGVERADE